LDSPTGWEWQTGLLRVVRLLLARYFIRVSKLEEIVPAGIQPMQFQSHKRFLKLNIFYLLPCFMLLSLLWNWKVTGVLYYCDDMTFPWWDFFPPFAHNAGSDHYIASENSVFELWFCFVAALFLLPVVPLFLFHRSRIDGNQ
jgi:hypothetical protein